MEWIEKKKEFRIKLEMRKIIDWILEIFKTRNDVLDMTKLSISNLKLFTKQTRETYSHRDTPLL